MFPVSGPIVNYITKPSKNTPTVFSACDSKYWDKYQTLIQSCVRFSQPIHIHLVNPREDILEQLYDFSDLVSFSFEQTDIQLDNPNEYYQSIRYIIAPELVSQCGSIFVMDYDTVLAKPLVWPSSELGIAIDPRPDSPGQPLNSNATYAACTYFSKVSDAEFVKQYIADKGFVRFVDQLALYELSLKSEDYEDLWGSYVSILKFFDYDSYFYSKGHYDKGELQHKFSTVMYDSKWSGDSITYINDVKPKGNVLVAGTAADEFFDLWHELLFNTARINKQPLHVHILNPNQSVLEVCEKYQSEIMTFSYCSHELPLKCRPAVYYQNIRFFILPELFKFIDKAMAIDFDTMVLKKFDFPSEDIGVSLNPFPNQHKLHHIIFKPNDNDEQHLEKHQVYCYATLISKKVIDYVYSVIDEVKSIGWIEHVDHLGVWRSLKNRNYIDLLYTYICPTYTESLKVDIHTLPMWTSDEYSEIQGSMGQRRWLEKYDYICNNEVG